MHGKRSKLGWCHMRIKAYQFTDQATSHYLNQWWSISLTHICTTWAQRVHSFGPTHHIQRHGSWTTLLNPLKANFSARMTSSMETFSALLAICAGNSPVTGDKGQLRGALMSSWTCAWINSWVNIGEAGDLRRHRTHYDVIVMRNINMYLKCLSFLHTDRTQVAEIPPHVRQGPTEFN